ncbi:E3 ubiquitin ligase BIG BROTHER [Vitis vinifera]|uniref:E3 ubiquitin ligase BIG BROTHER n=1 Tax=Vitis vinifera TaxID=29760 RepID=A0A438HLT1_VITVI|nr:E3 ubiquitin ligase BIG BROTHER [Vitis vinifera]
MGLGVEVIWQDNIDPDNMTYEFPLVGNRCVICQMEYKRRDRLITLPCKHVYHAACGTRWLSINKVRTFHF